MGRLTTHVLDTTHGLPGRSIQVRLFRIVGDQRQPIKEMLTNDDGRCDEPLLADDAFSVGVYELVFAVGAYFSALESETTGRTSSAAEPRFLDEVVLRFGVAEPDQHYHVPLLISPFSYSTYRGS